MKFKGLAFFILFVINLAFNFCQAQSLLWTKQPLLVGPQRPATSINAVVRDPEGNIYAVGNFQSTTMCYGTDTLSTGDNPEFFLVKFDFSGNPLWARQGHQSCPICGSDARSITIDPSGNVIIAGSFIGALILGSSLLTTQSTTYSETFIAKYDRNGNVLWAKQSYSNAVRLSFNQALGCVADKYGNVYATGNFYDTTAFGQFTLKTSSNDVFLVKYDSTGNVIWARQSKSTHPYLYNYGNAVAVDPANNVYITGNFSDTLTFGNQQLISVVSDTSLFSGIKTTPSKCGDVFIAKYDENGNVLWAKQSNANLTTNLHGSFGDGVIGYTITTDRLGNVYIAGNFIDFIRFGSYTLNNPAITPSLYNNADIFIVRYDTEGNVVWAKAAEPINKACYFSWGLATDTFNHLYFAGGGCSINLIKPILSPNLQYTYSIKFGADTFTAPGQPSFECLLLLELDTAGNTLCGAVSPVGGGTWTGMTVNPAGDGMYIAGANLPQYNKTIVGPDTLTYSVTYIDSLIEATVPFLSNWLPCGVTPPLSASIIKTNVTCKNTCNGTATAHAISGTPPYSYLWSTGPSDTTYTVSGLCAANYTVTITDSTGTTTAATITITEPSLLAGGITSQKDTFCIGDTASLSLTTNAANILWQSSVNGINFNTIQGAVNLSYLFSVSQTTIFRAIVGTDVCSDTSLFHTVVASQSPGPHLITTDTLICSGDSAQVCESELFSSYLWNTGDRSSCTFAKTAGDYWLTVTDANGCSAISAHKQIAVYPVPSVSIFISGDTLSSFGAVNYHWLLNGDTIPKATAPLYVASQQGLYTVQVTDTNGCTTISSPITITGINILAQGQQAILYPNPALTGNFQLNVSSELIGNTLEVYDDNGRLIYQSQIRNLNTAINLNIASGIYWLRIPNANTTVVKKLVRL